MELDPDSATPSPASVGLSDPILPVPRLHQGDLLLVSSFLVSSSELGTEWPVLGHTPMSYLQGRRGIEYLECSIFVVLGGLSLLGVRNSANASSGIQFWEGRKRKQSSLHHPGINEAR